MFLSLGVENKKDGIRFIATFKKIETNTNSGSGLNTTLNDTNFDSKVDQFLKNQTLSLFRMENEVTEIKNFLQKLFSEKNEGFKFNDENRSFNRLSSNNSLFETPVYDPKKIEILEMVKQSRKIKQFPYSLLYF